MTTEVTQSINIFANPRVWKTNLFSFHVNVKLRCYKTPPNYLFDIHTTMIYADELISSNLTWMAPWGSLTELSGSIAPSAWCYTLWCRINYQLRLTHLFIHYWLFHWKATAHISVAWDADWYHVLRLPIGILTLISFPFRVYYFLHDPVSKQWPTTGMTLTVHLVAMQAKLLFFRYS